MYYYNCPCGSNVHTYKRQRHEQSKMHQKGIEFSKTSIYFTVSNSNITAELEPTPCAKSPSESKILTDKDLNSIGSPKCV